MPSQACTRTRTHTCMHQPCAPPTTLGRYYAEAKACDLSAGNPLREDIKRMERQAKEREQEAQMLDSMYQARGRLRALWGLQALMSTCLLALTCCA